MMKHQRPYYLFLIPAVCIFATAGFVYKAANHYHKDFPLKNEKELKVTLDAGFGNIWIAKGESNQILAADISADLPHEIGQYIDYSSRDRIGYLNINTTESVTSSEGRHKHNGSFHISGFEHNDWNLKFTDAAPISFDVQLGLGKGDIDLSGLDIKDLNLSTGASSVNLLFDKPNKSVIDQITIETGLSKFVGSGLCNANFRHLKFEGGVGGYSLDFAGKLDREVSADIEVGLGSLTVSLPEDIGAKIIYEKSLVAHLSIPREFREQDEGTYLSSNYYSAQGKIILHIEAGLGSVTIQRY
jgi:hypothetical protein